MNQQGNASLKPIDELIDKRTENLFPIDFNNQINFL